MTVAELIEWLKTQPQEAVVTCISHTSGSGYYDQGGNIEVVDMMVKPSKEGAYDETFEVINYTSDYFKDKPYYGRVELFIGRRE